MSVKSDAAYPIAGVYGFGRGLLLRDEVRGADISATTLYRIFAGQIIYSRLKAFEGAFALVPREAEGRYVSNEFPTFDVDHTQADPSFIAEILLAPRVWADIAERIIGMGARRERLRVADFLAFEIVLPSLEEQRSIVRVLDRVKTLSAASDREAETARDLLDAARESLLHVNAGWAHLPHGWMSTVLGEVSDVRSGLTKGRKASAAVSAVPFLRAANVQNGRLDLGEIKTIEATVAEVNRFRLEPGDVLMVEGSGSPERLGQGWLWEGQVDRCLHQNHVFRARPDPELIVPAFLAHVLSASPCREHCLAGAKSTSGLWTINKTEITAIPVVVPPREAQMKIVQDLETFRHAAISAQQVTETTRTLREALRSELLSGRRRVSATQMAADVQALVS